MPPRAELTPLSIVMRRVDAAADGTPEDALRSGFPSLDEKLGGGMRRGDLVVLGGDTGSGKSALALAIAMRAAETGRPVLLLSGEMAVDRLMERALAIEGRARIDDLRRGTMDEATRAGIGAAAVRLRDATLTVDRLSPGGAEALESELRARRTAELVVIDSLQSLAPGTREQDEELAVAVRALKSLALDLHLTIVVTAHLPRLDRGRADRRPQLDDYGALGAVRQHADIVLGLFREEMYQSVGGIEGATELIVQKNRNGATGYIDLFFYSQWMRFEDMLDPDR